MGWYKIARSFRKIGVGAACVEHIITVKSEVEKTKRTSLVFTSDGAGSSSYRVSAAVCSKINRSLVAWDHVVG